MAEQAVRIVPELVSDEAIRQKAAVFIGAVALSDCVEAPTDVQPIESLYGAIQAAEAGNENARKMIEVNARTDVIERTMKTGHVVSVDLMVDEAGKILQHGQSLDSVQANSLRYAANSWQMRERTEAETRNAFRIEHHNSQGDLDDNYFVVFSRAADNMSEKDMKKTGFFTDTMSTAIQITDSKDGRLVTESAFVAGVKQLGEARHDAATIVKLAQRFGVDLSGKSAAEIIDTPLLIPKKFMPGGVIDLVALYDEAAGDTFFGEAKQRQNYADYKKICEEREARFEPKVQTIVNQLISEARSIHNPIMASQRLHKISEEQMIQQAIGDDDIKPEVFGPAAPDIVAARKAYVEGRPEDVIKHVRRAESRAQSSSCAGGVNSTGEAGKEGSKSESTKDNEDCTFISKKCPKCKAKNVKTTVTKTEIRGSGGSGGQKNGGKCNCVVRK